MEIISLADLVSKIGQARVARELGAKPSSIAKALRARRTIIVTVKDDGSCEAQETRPFPSHKPLSLSEQSACVKSLALSLDANAGQAIGRSEL